jgi:hypothetical protein
MEGDIGPLVLKSALEECELSTLDYHDFVPRRKKYRFCLQDTYESQDRPDAVGKKEIPMSGSN